MPCDTTCTPGRATPSADAVVAVEQTTALSTYRQQTEFGSRTRLHDLVVQARSRTKFGLLSIRAQCSSLLNRNYRVGAWCGSSGCACCIARHVISVPRRMSSTSNAAPEQDPCHQ